MIPMMERNAKEILRDPLTLLFGLGLPLALLGMMTAINSASPVQVWQFQPEIFLPAMAVFSLAFMTLFSGQLLAHDRASAFLSRVFASPMPARSYILSYAAPCIAVGLTQSLACLLAGLLLGVPPRWSLLLAPLALLPTAVLFVALGLTLGALLSEKQVGGLCGGIVVNLAGLAGGIWFDLRMFGEPWQRLLYALPFAHSVDTARAALRGDWSAMLPHLGWTTLWAVACLALALLLFDRRKRLGLLSV